MLGSLHQKVLAAVVCATASLPAPVASTPALESIPPFKGPHIVLTPAFAMASPAATTLAERRDVQVIPLESRDALDLRAARAARPNGGGADVLELVVLQVEYSTQDGQSSVLLEWSEALHNSSGVDLFMDNTFLETLDGLPDEDSDGCVDSFFLPQRRCRVINVPDGEHVFRVEERGNTAVAVNATQVVVADRVPVIGTVSTGTCSTQESEDGVCEFSINWETDGPSPNFYRIEVNGTAQTDVGGRDRQAFVGIVQPQNAQQVIRLVGIKSVEESLYRDTTFEFPPCELNCTVSCPPPTALEVTQVAYGADPTLRIITTDGASYDGGREVFLNGKLLGTSTSPNLSISGFAPGEHVLGVRGLCSAAAGGSAIIQQTFEVLATSPVASPTVDGVRCRLQGEVMTVSWTYTKPHRFADVYFNGNDASGGRVGGCTQTFNVTGTTLDTLIELQFFDTVGDHVYASERIPCEFQEAETLFIRGLCDGNGIEPQLTSAVFGLNFLFGGGAEPPCREACDTNANGEFELSDLVNLLNFLFLGGTPPLGWTDQDGDGNADPTCLVGTPAGCQTGHSECPR